MKSDKYKILYESINEKVDKLLGLYKKDKHKARVIFMNNNSKDYSIKRVVIFFHENGKFNIVHFKKSYGISKTNKLYSSQSQVEQIIYKDNKLWHRFSDRGSLKIRALCLMGLQSWHSNTEKEVRVFLLEKFGWLRFVIECNIQELTFNTIIRNKLYSLNDCLKYMYKIPLPIAKLFFEKKVIDIGHQHYTWYKALKIYKPYLINIENLKIELLNNNLFSDTLRMARILGKTINCSWGLKRLTQEHDDWGKEITNIVLEEEPLRELNVDKLFIQFAEYSGYKLLTTNKDLLGEGMRQQHCVGTYIEAVDYGKSGIYSIDRYTLELVKSSRNEASPTVRQYIELRIRQFRGLRNCDATKELYDEVLQQIHYFNNIINDIKEETQDQRHLKMFVNNLPLIENALVDLMVDRNNNLQR